MASVPAGDPTAARTRSTVSLDASIVRLLDLQATAEGSTRTALTRKAINFYAAMSVGRAAEGTAIVAVSTSPVPEPTRTPSGKRQTILLSEDSAALADELALAEETSRSALTRKAVRYYLNRAAGRPNTGTRIIVTDAVSAAGRD